MSLGMCTALTSLFLFSNSWKYTNKKSTLAKSCNPVRMTTVNGGARIWNEMRKRSIRCKKVCKLQNPLNALLMLRFLLKILLISM
jgi:hypothetical protein